MSVIIEESVHAKNKQTNSDRSLQLRSQHTFMPGRLLVASKFDGVADVELWRHASGPRRPRDRDGV